MDAKTVAWLQAIGVKNRRCLREVYVMTVVGRLARHFLEFSEVLRHYSDKTNIAVEFGPVQVREIRDHLIHTRVVHFK